MCSVYKLLLPTNCLPLLKWCHFLSLTPIRHLDTIVSKFTNLDTIVSKFVSSVPIRGFRPSLNPADSANRFPAPKTIMFHRSLIFVGCELINWRTVIGFRHQWYLWKKTPILGSWLNTHNTQSTVLLYTPKNFDSWFVVDRHTKCIVLRFLVLGWTHTTHKVHYYCIVHTKKLRFLVLGRPPHTTHKVSYSDSWFLVEHRKVISLRKSGNYSKNAGIS